MVLKEATISSDRESFFAAAESVYAPYPQYRPAGNDIPRLMLEGVSPFCRHAVILPYLILDSDAVVGRFAFIQDEKLPGVVQVAWFEALPGIRGLAETIRNAAKKLFPRCNRLVVGLNGHLNYGAGFLLNRYEEAPVFDLSWTPPYYPRYFEGLHERRMVTFHTSTQLFYDWGARIGPTVDLKGITVRSLDLDNFEADVQIYTDLNNACFHAHPYWAERSGAEDSELFRTLGPFLRGENLLFALFEGKPVGYLLWLPDLNELLEGSESLGSEHLLKYQNGFRFRSYRFYEIAALPSYGGLATLSLFLAILPYLEALGCRYGEGGFIFEDNLPCIQMTRRFFQRALSQDLDPYRYLAVYESGL